MKKRNLARNRNTAKKSSPINSRYLLLTGFCGLVLVASFFFAARQHFSSIDYSIKNSKLRKQVDDLESDKRRLQLAREVSLTPAEIKKAAKKFGFTESDNPGEVARTAIAETAKFAKSEIVRTADTAKLVQKTVESKPVTASDARPRKVEKLEKTDTTVRDRKVQVQTARR